MRPSASVLIALVAASARGEATGDRHEVPVLVELFSSEGCSSCPPAEQVLSRLLAHPPDGVRVIALEEHVDYWDGLGWKDRFASPELSRRQEAYVRRMGLTGPYTPQLVVGGRGQVVGGDERSARSLISGAARAPRGIVELHVVENGSPHLRLEVRAGWDGGAGEVVLAAVRDHARGDVTSGENAGRVLDHVAVVRELLVVGRGTDGFRATVDVPRSAIEGATRIVLFVQAPAAGPVLAVASTELGATPGRARPGAPGARRVGPRELPGTGSYRVQR